MWSESMAGSTISFMGDVLVPFFITSGALGNKAIRKKVMKLIKIYSRMGAKYDMRFPARYALVNCAGLKKRLMMVRQNALS
jgi:hypothetical protein